MVCPKNTKKRLNKKKFDHFSSIVRLREILSDPLWLKDFFITKDSKVFTKENKGLERQPLHKYSFIRFQYSSVIGPDPFHDLAIFSNLYGP